MFFSQQLQSQASPKDDVEKGRRDSTNSESEDEVIVDRGEMKPPQTEAGMNIPEDGDSMHVQMPDKLELENQEQTGKESKKESDLSDKSLKTDLAEKDDVSKESNIFESESCVAKYECSNAEDCSTKESTAECSTVCQLNEDNDSGENRKESEGQIEDVVENKDEVVEDSLSDEKVETKSSSSIAKMEITKLEGSGDIVHNRENDEAIETEKESSKDQIGDRTNEPDDDSNEEYENKSESLKVNEMKSNDESYKDIENEENFKTKGNICNDNEENIESIKESVEENECKRKIEKESITEIEEVHDEDIEKNLEEEKRDSESGFELETNNKTPEKIQTFRTLSEHYEDISEAEDVCLPEDNFNHLVTHANPYDSFLRNRHVIPDTSNKGISDYVSEMAKESETASSKDDIIVEQCKKHDAVEIADSAEDKDCLQESDTVPSPQTQKVQSDSERNIFDVFPVDTDLANVSDKEPEQNIPDIEQGEDKQSDPVASTKETTSSKETSEDVLNADSSKDCKSSKHKKTNKKPLFKQSSKRSLPKKEVVKESSVKIDSDLKTDEGLILEKAKSKYPFLKELRVALHTEEVKSTVQLSSEKLSKTTSKKASKSSKAKTSKTVQESSKKQSLSKENSHHTKVLEEGVDKKKVPPSSDNYKPLKKRSRHAVDGDTSEESVSVGGVCATAERMTNNKLLSTSNVPSKPDEQSKETISIGHNKHSGAISGSESKFEKTMKGSAEEVTSNKKVLKEKCKGGGGSSGSQKLVKDMKETDPLDIAKKGGKHSIVKKYPERSCKYRQPTVTHEPKPVSTTPKPQYSQDQSSKPKTVKTEIPSVKPKTVKTEIPSVKPVETVSSDSKVPKKKRKRKVKPWSWGNEKKRSKPKAKLQTVSLNVVTDEVDPEKSTVSDTGSIVCENVNSPAETGKESKTLPEPIGNVNIVCSSDIDAELENKDKKKPENIETEKSGNKTRNSDAMTEKKAKKSLKKSKKSCRNRKSSKSETGIMLDNESSHTVNHDHMQNVNLGVNEVAIEADHHVSDQIDMHEEHFPNVSPDSGIQSLAGSPAGNESPNSLIHSNDQSSHNLNCTVSSGSVKHSVVSVTHSNKHSTKASPINVSANGIVSSVHCVTASASASSYSVTTSLKSSSETTTVFSKSVPLSSVSVSSSLHIDKSCKSSTASDISYSLKSPSNLPSAITSPILSGSISTKDSNSSEAGDSPSKKKKRAKFLHLHKTSTLLQKGRLPTEEEKEQRLEDKFGYLSKVGTKLSSSSDKANEQQLLPNTGHEQDKSDSDAIVKRDTKKNSHAVVKTWLDEQFQKDSILPEAKTSEQRSGTGHGSSFLDISFSDNSQNDEDEVIHAKTNIETPEQCEETIQFVSNVSASDMAAIDTLKSSSKSRKKRGKRKRSHSRTHPKTKKRFVERDVELVNGPIKDMTNELVAVQKSQVSFPPLQITIPKQFEKETSVQDDTDSTVNECETIDTLNATDAHSPLENNVLESDSRAKPLDLEGCGNNSQNLSVEDVKGNVDDDSEDGVDDETVHNFDSNDHASGESGNDDVLDSVDEIDKVVDDSVAAPNAVADNSETIDNEIAKTLSAVSDKADAIPVQTVHTIQNDSTIPVKKKRGRPPSKKAKVKIIPLKQKYHQKILKKLKVKPLALPKVKRILPALVVNPDGSVVKRGPGRPKGSKNKMKEQIVKIKKTPGRPKGALNKVKKKPVAVVVDPVPSGSDVVAKAPPETPTSSPPPMPTMMQWRESLVLTGEGEEKKKKGKTGRGPGRPRKHPLFEAIHVAKTGTKNKTKKSETKSETKSVISKPVKPVHVPECTSSGSGTTEVSDKTVHNRPSVDALSEYPSLFGADTGRYDLGMTKLQSKFKRKRDKDQKISKLHQPVENTVADGLIFPSRLDGRELEPMAEFSGKELFNGCFESDNSGYGLSQFLEMNRHRRKKNKKKLFKKSKHKNIIDPVFNAEVENMTNVFPQLSICGETYIRVRPGEVPRPSIFKMVRIDVKKKKKDKLFVFEKAKPLKSKMDEMLTKDKLKCGRRISTLGESFLDLKDTGASRTSNLPPKKRHKLFSPISSEEGHEKPEKRKVGRPRKQPLPQANTQESSFGKLLFPTSVHVSVSIRFMQKKLPV